MKKGFAILIYLFFLSCSDKSNRTTISPNSEDKKDFIKIIPKTQDGKLCYAYEITKRATEKSVLTTIENGFDSIFIRLWYIHRFEIEVLEFKKEAGFWNAEFHKVDFFLIRSNIEVEKVKSLKISPKSGWDFFVKRIFTLGITNLPDDSELSGYNGLPNDADFAIVEVSTSEKYRLYSYTMPILFPEIKEAKAMEDIMELIENEFGIKRLNPWGSGIQN